jgi:predicted permease
MNRAKFACRLLLRNKAFTIPAVLSLSLAMAFNCSLFSLVNAIYFRALPGVSAIEKLVSLDFDGSDGTTPVSISYPDYSDFKNSKTFSDSYVSGFLPAYVDTNGSYEKFRVNVVSGNYFKVLGVNPLLGRTFNDEEAQSRAAAPVVVLNHRFWRTHFFSDPSVIGKIIKLNASQFTVVGVAPAEFRGDDLLNDPDVWVPILTVDLVQPEFSRNGVNILETRGQDWLRMRARLKADVTFSQARGEITNKSKQVEKDNPSFNQGRRITLVPLATSVRQETLKFTFVGLYLQLLAILLLMLGCSNVANLMLSLAQKRKHEMAIRLAIGASRKSLIAQLITESVLLAVLSAGIGLLVSNALLGMIGRKVAAFNEISYYQFGMTLGVDGRVLLYTLGMVLVTSVLFGLAPSLQATRVDLNNTLKGDVPATALGNRFNFRNFFVISQIALSIILLISSGLFFTSLRNTLKVDLGFHPEKVLVLPLDLEMMGYKETQGSVFFDQVMERLRSLPGIQTVSLGQHRPLGFTGTRIAADQGDKDGSPGYVTGNFACYSSLISPGYFQTLGIPLLAGRDFTRQDTKNSDPVVIVNQMLAKELWQTESPLGKRIRIDRKARGTRFRYGDGKTYPGTWLTVVGVAKNSTYHRIGDLETDFLYLPLSQRPYEPACHLFLKVNSDARRTLDLAREMILQFDKNLPAFNLKPMSEYLRFRYFLPKQTFYATTAIALVGLIVAGVGLYGVMSYVVSQRTKEIGIRMSIGATPLRIMKMIFLAGGRLFVIGALTGLFLAYLTGKLIASYFFAIGSFDPIVSLIVTLFLAVISMLACFTPAIRASRVNPVDALRSN